MSYVKIGIEIYFFFIHVFDNLSIPILTLDRKRRFRGLNIRLSVTCNYDTYR